MVQGSKNILQSWLSRHIYFSREEIPQRPMNVVFSLESACNLHCIQCDIWRTRKVTLKTTLSQKKQIINKLVDWLGPFTLNIFAGEPLIHPQLFDLLAYCSQHSVKTIITTNGTVLTDQMIRRLIEVGLTAMFVSLDGTTAQAHDYIRGVKGTFDKVVRGVGTMVRMRGKRTYPKIVIESLIMSKNIHEVALLPRLAQSLGAQGVVFQPVVSKYGFGSAVYRKNWHKSADSLLPNTQDAKIAIASLIAQKREGISILNSYEHLERANLYFRDPDQFVRDTSCLAHNNFAISEDGTVYLCYAQRPIGNAFSDDLGLLWNSFQALDVRKKNRFCSTINKIILCNSVSLASLFDIEDGYSFQA